VKQKLNETLTFFFIYLQREFNWEKACSMFINFQRIIV